MFLIRNGLRSLNTILSRKAGCKPVQIRAREFCYTLTPFPQVEEISCGATISSLDLVVSEDEGIPCNLPCEVDDEVSDGIGNESKTFDVLRGLGIEADSIRKLLDRFPFVMKHNITATLKPLWEQLEEFGIGKQLIGRILIYNPRFLLRMNQDDAHMSASRLRDLVTFLLQHGLDMDGVGRVLKIDPLMLVFTSHWKMQGVVEFLEELGINETSINGIIRRYPSILTRNHAKGLRLKVQFLKNLGMDNGSLSKMIIRYPQIMGYSFEHKFKPTVAFLEDSGLKGEALVRVLMRAPQILGKSMDKSFSKRLEFFSRLGFDPKSDKFAVAMCITASIGFDSLESRFNQFVRLGLSNTDVCKILKSQPQILKQSEEDIQNKVEFLVKHMKHPVTALSKAPVFLLYSLEQRTKPRNEVMSFLYSRKKLTKVYCWTTTMTMTEKKFMEKFVDAFPEAAFYKSQKSKALNAVP